MRAAALRMLDRVSDPRQRPRTLGADTQYQTAEFVAALRQRRVAPHLGQYVHGNLGKNHLTEAEQADPMRVVSQRRRKLIERVFGWAKLNRGLRQVKLRGLNRVDWFYKLTIAGYNRVRLPGLIQLPNPAR